MDFLKKLPRLFSTLVLVLFVAGVCGVAAGEAEEFYGTVSVADSHFITSQSYPMHSGVEERTTTPLDDFPLPCTSCDAASVTEFCDGDGVCVKLSDRQISIIARNGSLLDGSPFSLNSQCTPRYLQELSSDSYAVICRESSYHLFHITGTDSPQLEEIIKGSGKDGILVQSAFGQQRVGLHHVETDIDIIVSHNVFTGTLDYIYPDINCMPHSLSLHAIFSSSGNFIVSCSTSNEERAYFWHSVVQYDGDPEPINLCGNPIASPKGTTFAVACNDTLVVYRTNSVEHYNSEIFSSRIVYLSYLNPTTIIVDTENQQHIVSVGSSGFDGILTLRNTTNCTFVHKLITRELYATACENTTQYYVRLVNTTSGTTTSVENLTREPLDVFFSFQRPPSIVTNTAATTTAETSPTDSLPPNTDSEEEMANIPPSKKSLESEKTTSKFNIIAIVLAPLSVGVATIILLVVTYIFYRYRKHSKQISRHPSVYLASGATTPDSSMANSSAPSIAGSRDELEMLNSLNIHA